MGPTASGRWFHLPGGAKPHAPTRLILIPHGGGAAASYSRWASLLPDEVELLIVQLPGRHDRRNETPFTRLTSAVDGLLEAFFAEWDGRRFALFGHSMGAMLGYRLTVELARCGDPGPVLLGASSWAPGAPKPGVERVQDMSDVELVEMIRELGALPEPLASDIDMLQYVLPALRADFAVYASFVDDGAKVDCPVAAYGARSDSLLFPGAMEVWGDLSSRYLGYAEFPGDHFYLEEHAVAVVADLIAHLRRI